MRRFSWLAFVLVACSSVNDDRVGTFIGAWTYQSGASSMIDCDDNQRDRSVPLTGSFQITAGTSSDLIEVISDPYICLPERLDVSGSVASAQVGQSCTYGTPPDTETETTSIGTYTLTLDSVGTTVTLNARATTSIISGGLTVTCTVTVAGTAMKTGARTTGEPGVRWIDPLPGQLR